MSIILSCVVIVAFIGTINYVGGIILKDDEPETMEQLLDKNY